MCLRYLNNGARCEVRPTWTWTNFAFLEMQTQLPSFTFPHHPIRNLNLLDSTQLLPSQNQTTRRSTCQIARTAAFLLLAKVHRISSFPQRLELKIALAASRPLHCKLKQGKLSQRIHPWNFLSTIPKTSLFFLPQHSHHDIWPSITSMKHSSALPSTQCLFPIAPSAAAGSTPATKATSPILPATPPILLRRTGVTLLQTKLPLPGTEHRFAAFMIMEPRSWPFSEKTG